MNIAVYVGMTVLTVLAAWYFFKTWIQTWLFMPGNRVWVERMWDTFNHDNREGERVASAFCVVCVILLWIFLLS